MKKLVFLISGFFLSVCFVPPAFAWTAGPTGYWCDESGNCYYGGGVSSASSSYSSPSSGSSSSYDSYYQTQTASIAANAAVTAMDMIITKLAQRRQRVLQERAVQREQYRQRMAQRKAEKEEEARERRERQETRREKMREASINVQNAIGQLEATIQGELASHAPLAVDFAPVLGTIGTRDAGAPLGDDEISAIEKEYRDSLTPDERKTALPLIDPQVLKGGGTPPYSIEDSKRIKEFWDRAAERRVEELKAEGALEEVREAAKEDAAKKIGEWKEDQKWAEGWIADGSRKKYDDKYDKYLVEHPWLLKEQGREEEEIWQAAIKEHERRKKEGWPNLSRAEIEKGWSREDDLGPAGAVWPGPKNPEKPLPNPIAEDQKELEDVLGIYWAKVEQRNEEKALKALTTWLRANEENAMKSFVREWMKDYEGN